MYCNEFKNNADFWGISDLVIILIRTRENEIILAYGSEKMVPILWTTLRDTTEQSTRIISIWKVYINAYARFSMTLYFLGFAKVNWPFR